MNTDELTHFEKRLTKEVELIELHIKELEAEKKTLSKQLSKARAERTGLQFTTRKNSMNRVLAENSVLEKLKEADNPLSTQELYQNALMTNFALKQTTFRSYLHRMKNAGFIKTIGHAGRWGLTEKS